MARQTLIANPWQNLRAMTPARIALGRCGVSLPTAVHLEFQLAHAQARDAVHLALDVDQLCQEIETLGLPTLALHSAAADREIYLQRPDLGRQLDEASRLRLAELQSKASAKRGTRIAFVVADGLSALAVQRHAAALLGAIKTRLLDKPEQQAVEWQIAPVAVVEQGRVAIGDEIGEQFGSQIVVVLIGERPGLSSPDSLGIYLTWAPKTGRSDAERNCISNVRPQGLPCEAAAQRLAYLIVQAVKRQLSGVELKDDSDSSATCVGAAPTTAIFLLDDQS